MSGRRLDVAVIGGGPAGLAAADAAAGNGRSVLLLDQGVRTGGQIWRHRSGARLSGRARALVGAVRPPRVAIAHRASVVDAHSAQELVVDFNGRVAVVETDAVILACGATERLLPFPGWTLPGVVGVGAMQALVKSGLDVSGSRVVLAGSGPLLLPVAATLRAAGATVVLIGEQAPRAAVRQFAVRALRDPVKLWQAMRYRAASFGVPFHTDTWVVRAEGDHRLRDVTLNIDGRLQTEPCDWLATAAGLVPRTELATLLGCAVTEHGIVVDELQATTVASVWAAGECCGVKGDAAAVTEGHIAGISAAGEGTVPRHLLRRRERGREFGFRLAEAFAPRPELVARITPTTIICRCEDVRREAIDPGWSQRQAKLWTRVAMGACQGAVCGVACEALFGWRRNAVRAPLDQPPLGAWASALGTLTPPDHAVDELPPPPVA